jgi:hypothetical protein
MQTTTSLNAANKNSHILAIRYRVNCLRAERFVPSSFVFSAATELLAMKIWYRTKVWIKESLSGDTPQETPTAPRSSATRLPQEIVEIIVGYLIYDTHSLLACSMTCYSWYMASFPHLHHTFITRPGCCFWDPKLEWPRSLQGSSKLGLLPFVKKFLVENSFPSPEVFSRKHFNSRRVLHQFSALINVQELGLFYLDIPSFMPCVRQFFGHFVPTVRSLTLGFPTGSVRQVLFFIGSFQHLDNLTFYGYEHGPQQAGLPDDSTLVPTFSPPLRGRLEVLLVGVAGLLKDMIHLFGGIRFRHIVLFNAAETQLLLSACAETLETLQLYPTDPRGKQYYVKCMWFPCQRSCS